MDNAEKIIVNGKKIFLIGTAHISRQSIELVKKTIEKEKPDSIGVELCESRFRQLMEGKKWGETDLGDIIKSGRIYLFLINILLSNIQRKFGESVGVKPGSEMLEAINLAQKKKIPTALLDRDVQITLKRAFRLMKFTEKIKLGISIFSGFFSSGEEITVEKIEQLKQKDLMSELMNELSRTAPTIKRVLVDERDAFIAQKILLMPGKKVVAVIGAGHIEGVKSFLNQKIDLQPLSIVPVKSNKWKWLKWIIPALFVIVFGYAFIAKGAIASLQFFALWFLITGGLSALGALIARAHWMSIATAFLAAPFTTLHPALAAGWFAGAVELKKRSPKVKDFEELNKLNSYGDFANNRVTKILLVTAYTNVGATIGVIIALPYLVSLLA